MDIRSTVLRQASREEMPIIQHIARIVYGQTYLAILGQPQVEYMLGKIYSTSALLEQLEQGHVFLIVQRQQQDVGFVSYNCAIEAQGVFKLQKLYVLSEMQGRGLGAYLVNTVTDQIRQRGGKILQLNVNRFKPGQGIL